MRLAAGGALCARLRARRAWRARPRPRRRTRAARARLVLDFAVQRGIARDRARVGRVELAREPHEVALDPVALARGVRLGRLGRERLDVGAHVLVRARGGRARGESGGGVLEAHRGRLLVRETVAAWRDAWSASMSWIAARAARLSSSETWSTIAATVAATAEEVEARRRR